MQGGIRLDQIQEEQKGERLMLKTIYNIPLQLWKCPIPIVDEIRLGGGALL